MSIRVIGCGNVHRSDDAAGVLVAERLRALGVPAEVQSGSAFELVESWYKDDDVVLIDAILTGSPVGTIRVWDGPWSQVPSNPQVSSHGFGVAEAINLARILQLLPHSLRVHGIEGRNFRMGEAVAPEVLRSIEEVAQQIASEYTRTAQTLVAVESGREVKGK